MGRMISWGNYPQHDHTKKSFEVNKLSSNFAINSIPFGNGRSYGDSCVSDHLIDIKQYNHFLSFDEETGVLVTQSGVLLDEIINTFLPKGWFLKVNPGTKFITVGGAIASDIHGKNHHIEGCFSESVNWFSLLLPSGEIKKCSREENTELFRATCGGMGLTGIIMDVEMQLKKINSKSIYQTTRKTKNLKETFEVFEHIQEEPYSVAWIDCLAKGKSVGKSLIMYGDFMDDGDLIYEPKEKMNVPIFFPSFILNTLSVKLFNYLYYRKVSKKITKQKVGFDKFFFPLDSIANWNRIYGKKGFTQYQFILPKENSFHGLKEILQEIEASGKGSFLAVLKLYGKSNENYLSFPLEGYSLALDFKIEKGIFELLEKLDTIVVKYKGRIYLSKDVRVSKATFEKGYPNIEKFREIRKKYNLKELLTSLQSKRVEI
ncbi:MAG: FAD-binding oxidoreductase [Flavobacteriaceae bacterium]|nr:FAD-binding oxidoreductase [Flavobacteriaceae bacterium]